MTIFSVTESLKILETLHYNNIFIPDFEKILQEWKGTGIMSGHYYIDHLEKWLVYQLGNGPNDTVVKLR